MSTFFFMSGVIFWALLTTAASIFLGLIIWAAAVGAVRAISKVRWLWRISKADGLNPTTMDAVKVFFWCWWEQAADRGEDYQCYAYSGKIMVYWRDVGNWELVGNASAPSSEGNDQ